MTRRKFLQVIAGMFPAVLGALAWLAKKACPRKFVRAVRGGSYPGRVKDLNDINKAGKWSG